MADVQNSANVESIEDNVSFLLGLYRAGLALSERELYKYFLDHSVEITESSIGFFHIVGADQKTIILTAWNQEALTSCIAPYETHYPIERAGNWADCIRLKQPIIYNDFSNSPNQKGLPKGHVTIIRMLSIPLIEDGTVFAIFGVGNKKADYTQNDIHKLELVASELNKILKQRHIESQLRQAKEQYHALFQNMREGLLSARCSIMKRGTLKTLFILKPIPSLRR